MLKSRKEMENLAVSENSEHDIEGSSYQDDPIAVVNKPHRIGNVVEKNY